MSLFRSLFPAHREAGAEILPSEGRLPPFGGATGWLNSEPLTPEGLRGRVVAVQFWTYTCVNWLRTLPYVREWAHKYHDHGLSVIGVHTPEFGFERDVDNVKAAARQMGVDYPVAIDSDYAVWNAFAKHYWPALYVADEEGRIRYHHFGEGAYAMSEMAVQQLLREAGKEGFDPGLVSVEPQGLEVAADWTDPTRRIPAHIDPVHGAFAEPATARTTRAPWCLRGPAWLLPPSNPAPARPLDRRTGSPAHRSRARVGPATGCRRPLAHPPSAPRQNRPGPRPLLPTSPPCPHLTPGYSPEHLEDVFSEARQQRRNDK